jgi:uncharacterized protein (DUF362 family)
MGSQEEGDEMSTSVAIVKGKNGKDLDELRAMMSELFFHVGPPTQIIPSGSRVLIKPNLTSEENVWEKGIVTSPLFVQALIEEVQKANPAEIVIAEAIAVGLDTKKAFTANGYEEVARITGARLLDLYDTEFEELRTVEGGLLKSVQVSKEVLRADFFINAPVLKTHFCSALTCAMKNLKGTTTYDEKKRFHYLGLNQAVAELNQVLKPHLHVVDASIAMEGDGPIAGTPVGLNVLMAGIDAVAVDTVAAQIMGINTDEVPILSHARKLGYGIWDEKRIEILCRSIEEVRRPFVSACREIKLDLDNLRIVDGEACPSCREGLRIAVERLQAAGAPLDRLPQTEIRIGSKATLPESPAYLLIPVGNCQNQYKHLPNYTPGCPPPTFLIADQIRELIGQPRKFGPREDFFMDK